jgi:ATP-dependent Clp protease ATP-binding subunit ClpC
MDRHDDAAADLSQAAVLNPEPARPHAKQGGTYRSTRFDKFSPSPRRVVVLAQEEAKSFRHDYIGTEHLLLGLIQVESAAAMALSSLDINLEEVRQHITEVVGTGRHEAPGHIYFTPRAKRAFQLSLTEAQQLGHDYIGAEHLLLGLIDDNASVAMQMLMEMGADAQSIRERVNRQLNPPDRTSHSA